VTLRARVFWAVTAVAAGALVLAAVLLSSSLGRQQRARIERDLVSQARLAAAVVSARGVADEPRALDAEADGIGRLVGARVTLIAADGRVVGDSAEDPSAIAALENHGARPEVVAARERGVGVSRRFSTTVGADMLYAAVVARHPQIAVVRLARPLDEVQQQLAAVRSVTILAFSGALAAALALSWLTSLWLSARMTRLAGVARRYAAGDFVQPARDYGRDEIGSVARALDESVHRLGVRMAELARDRARMGAILGGMAEGVLVVDDQGHVQLANDAVRQMLRLQGSVVGRHYLELIRHPDITAVVGAALEARTPEGEEVTLGRDPDRVFVARAAVVEAPGERRGAVLVLHEITDLRRAAQMRRDFVANVSHELRTPLTAIRGYLEAVMDADTNAQDARRFLETIARHTGRMERLIADLLRLARLDAGQETLEVVNCHVSELLDGVLAELAPTVEARRQRVEVHIAPDDAVVAGDPIKLHEVLRNLIENAVLYAPEDSAIRVDAEVAKAGVTLRVADEGPGIPERDLSRIFERFYRVDKARSRESGGTGLGLSIVKHLVGLHHGEVSAANRPEGGAVFTVTLPQ
jgi:two-component system phosphate regulon sensor histidine kinase PhoR